MYCCDFDDNKICLPDTVQCEDYNDADSYFDQLYTNIFLTDFIASKPSFKNKPVYIRKEPKYESWEHGFLHMTHRNWGHRKTHVNDRQPDFRRSERLTWVKYIINNFACSSIRNCNQLLYWEELFGGYIRPHLMMYDDEYGSAFLVVLEKRTNYYLIITSFYLEKSWEIKKRENKYNTYKKQKTPLT